MIVRCKHNTNTIKTLRYVLLVLVSRPSMNTSKTSNKYTTTHIQSFKKQATVTTRVHQSPKMLIKRSNKTSSRSKIWSLNQKSLNKLKTTSSCSDLSHLSRFTRLQDAISSTKLICLIVCSLTGIISKACSDWQLSLCSNIVPRMQEELQYRSLNSHTTAHVYVTYYSVNTSTSWRGWTRCSLLSDISKF